MFDPGDRQRELSKNTWSVGASAEEFRDAQASQVVAAVREVLEARRRRALDAAVEHATTFYVWHDEQAGALRLSTASCTPAELPFDAAFRLSTLEEVVYDWLRTGTWPELEDERGSPGLHPFVLPVFAARLEPWTAHERIRWWSSHGASEMRELLLVLWDPAGAFGTEGAQDAYDSHGDRLARLLAEGAGTDRLRTELAAARASMGLEPGREDRWVADHLLAWHPASTGREPNDACVRWNSDGVRVVRTLDELDALLDVLHRQYAHEPLRASVQHRSCGTLGVGLGRDDSVLDYVGPAPQWPPYHVSRGDLTPADEEVDWTWSGHHSPSSRGELIPYEEARAAARAFFERGALLRTVRWSQI